MRAKLRPLNHGWRLDYFCLSDGYEKQGLKVVDSEIYDQVMGSDHCPIKLKISLEETKETKKGKSSSAVKTVG
jgi:exodeoxyribonuclease III